MTINVYAVQDIKADRFNAPFFIQTHLEAIRIFGDNCILKESLWCKHPEDFRLFHLGTFNDQTGNIYQEIRPVLLSSALDFQKQEPGHNQAGIEYLSQIQK